MSEENCFKYMNGASASLTVEGKATDKYTFPVTIWIGHTKNSVCLNRLGVKKLIKDLLETL